MGEGEAEEEGRGGGGARARMCVGVHAHGECTMHMCMPVVRAKNGKNSVNVNTGSALNIKAGSALNIKADGTRRSPPASTSRVVKISDGLAVGRSFKIEGWRYAND